MIVIIDYGMGNLGSIANMLKKIGSPAVITSDPNIIAGAKKLILPGVGSFDHGMQKLTQLGLVPLLTSLVVNKKIPVLGICLGMQLMTQRSEEGVLPGLGWIDAETVKFRFSDNTENLKVPHMGWNTTKLCKKSSLFDSVTPEPRFYFVHSYYVVCKNEEDILTKTFHGYEFVSAFVRENIVGVQFHPEKSHKFGMSFLRSFVEF